MLITTNGYETIKSHNLLFLQEVGGAWCKVLNVCGRGVTKIKYVWTKGDGSPNSAHNWMFPLEFDNL